MISSGSLLKLCVRGLTTCPVVRMADSNISLFAFILFIASTMWEGSLKSVMCKSLPYNGSTISELRVSYRDKSDVLLEDNLESKNPFHLFSLWFKKASECHDVRQPNAACLATATKSGIPSARFVLIKAFDESGFTFYTNSESRKGRELEENPLAAMTIYWDALDRSVRIEGAVEKISETETDEYFNTRPKSSQIGAHVSRQSTVIASRDVLSKLNKKLETEYADKQVLRPSYWHGYKIIPKMMEFWQGQSDRLHDRIVFERTEVVAKSQVVCHTAENGWVFYRLSP